VEGQIKHGQGLVLIRIVMKRASTWSLMQYMVLVEELVMIVFASSDVEH